MKEAIEESNKKIQTWISQRHEKPKRWYSKEAYIYADEITDKIKKANDEHPKYFNVGSYRDTTNYRRGKIKPRA